MFNHHGACALALMIGCVYLSTHSQILQIKESLHLNDQAHQVAEAELNEWRSGGINNIEIIDPDDAGEFITYVQTHERYIHKHNDILLNKNYPELLKMVGEVCQPHHRLAGKRMFDHMIKVFESRLQPEKLSMGVRLLLQSEHFDKVIANEPLLTTLDVNEYCTGKYAIIYFKQFMTKMHTKHLGELGLFQDFRNGSELLPKEAHQAKVDLLEYIAYRDLNYGGSIIEDNYFSEIDLGINIEELSTLPDQQEEIAELLVAIAKTKFMKILAEFKQYNVFTKQDVARLIDGLKFVIPNDCGRYDAEYAFINESDEDNLHAYEYIHDHSSVPKEGITLTLKLPKSLIDKGFFYENTQQVRNNVVYHNGDFVVFDGITFTIPSCHDFPNIIEFSEQLEHVMLHEIGHYMYHRKDAHSQDFVQLCWDDALSTTHTCKDKDFVSSYATSIGVEDYAESFAAFTYRLFYGTTKEGLNYPSKDKIKHFIDFYNGFSQ